MKPRIRFVTCEICGVRATRNNHEKRMFIAKFPMDEPRCKQWVKFTGKEDLAYVPIEKLHTLKYICGKHFTIKDFNKRMNRLKRSAIPSMHLTRPPLSDDILQDFPLHRGDIPDSSDPLVKILNDDHDYNCSIEKKIVELPVSIQTGKKRLAKEESLQHESALDPSIEKEDESIEAEIYESIEYIEEEESLSGQEDSAVVPSDGEEETPTRSTEKEFSWQKESAVVPCDDDDDDDDDDTMAYDTGSAEKAPASPTYDHKKYRCDNCSRDILGFRYVCVQCAHVYLCGACEARQAHPHHYVLRIPGARPRGEVSAMLAKIRRALLSDSLLPVAGDRLCDEIEVKEEPVQEDQIQMNSEQMESNDQELDNSCELVADPADNSPSSRAKIQQTSEMKQSSTTQPSIIQNELYPKKKLFLTVEPMSTPIELMSTPIELMSTPTLHIKRKLEPMSRPIQPMSTPIEPMSTPTLHMTRKLVPIEPTAIQTSLLECDVEKKKMLLKKLQGIDAYRENNIGLGRYGAKFKFSELPEDTSKIIKLDRGCNIITKPERPPAKTIKVDSGCIVKNTDKSQSPADAIKASNRAVPVKPRPNKIISRLKQQLKSGSARVCLQRLSVADLRAASSQAK